MPLKPLDNISNGILAICTPITYHHLAHLLNRSIKSNVFLIELECSLSYFLNRESKMMRTITGTYLKVHVNPKIQVFLNTRYKRHVTDATHMPRRFGFCCILVACFLSKIAPSWMWKMYVMGETLNFMDIVVLWCFGRWIGDTRAFSTVNWRFYNSES